MMLINGFRRPDQNSVEITPDFLTMIDMIIDYRLGFSPWEHSRENSFVNNCICNYLYSDRCAESARGG